FCRWPPNVFAAMAHLLKRSGAYTRVLSSWPPGGSQGKWEKDARDHGKSWRDAYNQDQSLPNRVQLLWTAICANSASPVSQIRLNKALAANAVELLAIADECCVGVGLPAKDRD